MIEFVTSPIAQDTAYHLFADQRKLLGVPGFWNVVSNLPFLLVGVAGLAEVRRHTRDPLCAAWFAFFAGVALTAFGSAWYHLDPDNASLAWDRLAMVIGLMSFVALVIGEYVSITAGRRLLMPLLVLGVLTVWYWLRTEMAGAGDLRPYAIVQFAPLLFVPVLVVARRARSDLSVYIGWMLAFYVLAKVFEHYDEAILAFGNILSGHSLKHLAAACAAASLLVGLRRRHTAGDIPE